MREGPTAKVGKLEDYYQCHRSYRSMEVKKKWIGNQFQFIINNNSDIRIGVLEDLLQDMFKVNVSNNCLYKEKVRVLKVLSREHVEA